MSALKWSILFVGLALMGGTAAFLSHLKDFQKLGQPGVRVVDRPMLDPKGKVAKTNSIDLPERVLDYESRQEAMDFTEIEGLPKDTLMGRRLYTARDDRFQLLLTAVLMGTDRSSIHKPQACLTGAGWKILKVEPVEVPVTKPHDYPLPVVRMILSKDIKLPDGRSVTRQGIYMFWFVSDSRITADYAGRMWWQALEMLKTRVMQRWAYISCFAICDPGSEERTFRRMEDFLAAAAPEFQLVSGPPGGPARAP